MAAERDRRRRRAGIIELRQWGRGRVAAERIEPAPEGEAPYRVNGAAAEWPRNGSTESSCPPATARQWGRGRVAAERWLAPKCATCHLGRQWGRGRVAAERL